MGGNDVPNATRMSRDLYLSVARRICSVLEMYYNYVALVKSNDEKTSFGDIDIIVAEPTIPLGTCIHIGYNQLRKHDAKGRDGNKQMTWSYNSQCTYQVDIFQVSTISKGIHLTLDYGYLAMIIGFLLSEYKIYFRKSKYIIVEEPYSIHLLEDDTITYNKIEYFLLNFLGLKVSAYTTGFKTYAEAYNFIKCSHAYSKAWTRCKMIEDNKNTEMLALLKMTREDTNVPEKFRDDQYTPEFMRKTFPKSYEQFELQHEKTKERVALKRMLPHSLVESWRIKATQPELGKAIGSFLARPDAVDFMTKSQEVLKEAFIEHFLSSQN